ncbi:MAG: SbcC/MukB-like Walker B domain-containing protein [Bacteroidia bacterium]
MQDEGPGLTFTYFYPSGNMIPLTLSIEGLYSYQEPQQIDFRHLGEAALFGIFGATGSGKSSILEAISFALYGRTERLHAREPGGGMAYHMMNLKSDRLRIAFEFMGGRGESERYRFSVENKRHGKTFEQTQNFKRSAYKWEAGAWIPIEQTAEEVVGLSYDHFKRTIIIPQGKFEEFIQLGAKDRSQMLQEIFGLEKYDLSEQVRSLSNKNRIELETQRSLWQQYASVDAALLAGERLAIVQLQTARQAQEADLKRQQREREHLEQLQTLSERLRVLEAQQAQLLAAQPAWQVRQQRLQRYQQAMELFSVLLTNHKQQSDLLQDTGNRIGEKQQVQQQVKDELAKGQHRLKVAEELFHQRDALLQQARELAQIIDLKASAETLAAMFVRVENGQKQIATKTRQIEVAEREADTLEAQIEDLRKQLPDMSQLVAVQTWFGEQARIRERIATETAQIDQLRGEIEQGKEDKLALADQVGIDLRPYDLPLHKLIDRVEAKLHEMHAERQRLDAAIDELKLRHQLHAMAGSLEAGLPCPLCGSTSHPAPIQPASDDAAMRRAETERMRAEATLEQIRIVLPKLQLLLDQARKLGTKHKQAAKQLQQWQQEEDLHRARFVWPGFDPTDRQGVEKSFAAAQQRNAQIATQSQREQALRDTIRKQRQEVGQWRPTLDQLSNEYSTLLGKFEQGCASLQHVRYEDYADKSRVDVQAAIQQLKDDHTSRVILYDMLAKENEERRSRLDTLRGEIDLLEKQHQRITGELAHLRQRIDEKLTRSPFDNIDAVRAALELALDSDAEKEAIRDYERQLTETGTSLRDLRAQIGDRRFDPEAYQALRAAIARDEAQLAHITQQIGGKQAEIERMEKDLAHKQRIETDIARLELRSDNLKTLERLFRGNGFVNYISTAYLENLCAAANERFLRLSNNSLSLEIDEENNFHVRDLLNGGHRRSVKTLSGGQTFQAALCLALALSDQVQQQVQARQNFFFLDEGFGSQDKQSLQVIFQTLKALRHENRIVGLISHVEELQQEIDTHLYVRLDPERGSLVRGSWE